MNKRLIELARQSDIPLSDDRVDPMVVYPNEVEKFAELIVRECVQTLIDNTPERHTSESAEEDWDKGYDQAMKDCVHHIQEHFGVFRFQ